MTRADEGKKHDWSTDAVGGLIMMIAVGLAVGAGIAGFFLGRDTKHSTVTASAGVAAGVGHGRPACRGGRPHLRPVRLRAMSRRPGPRRRLSRSARAEDDWGTAHRRAVAPHHQPRARRVRESEAALHARVGRRHLRHAGERADLVHPRRPPHRSDRDAAAGAGRPGPGGQRRDALRDLRLHQLPRPERARRRPQSALGGQDDPPAVGRGFPEPVQHGRQDRCCDQRAAA